MQVEIKTTVDTPNADMLQKAADFVHAFILGKPVPGVGMGKRLESMHVSAGAVSHCYVVQTELFTVADAADSSRLHW